MARGRGLAKGLRRTLQTFFTRPVTVEYPTVRPEIHPRYRGSFAFDPENCLACELCARACPNKVIALRWEKGEAPGKRRLTEYRMEPGTCLFCGLCAEACPTRALTMTPHFELATRQRSEAGMVDYRRVTEGLPRGEAEDPQPETRREDGT
ncbi:MAG: NuoI/complex I 23 kDa subunit family protein [Betaproteobacteria bacterium]